jgi:hypothetical protein
MPHARPPSRSPRASLPDAVGAAAADALGVGTRRIATAALTAGAASGGGRGAKPARPTFVQVYSEPLGKTSPNSHSQASKFFGEAR